MICGIYKITNKINNKCYIGQSRDIKRRWHDHRNKGLYDKSMNHYPLYRAFKKYGLENFNFEILEECEEKDLNTQEQYWIKKLSPEYNQTIGGDYQVVPQKLSLEDVDAIRKLLKNHLDITITAIAERYNVSIKTIETINDGSSWFSDSINYPIRKKNYHGHSDNYVPVTKKYYCIDCGKEIYKGAIRCPECSHIKSRKVERPSRDKLKTLIRTQPFLTIGKQFNVSDNAIRKWCIQYDLPSKKKDIKQYTDEEWDKL